MLTLIETFDSLKAPRVGEGEGLRFMALPIPGHEQHRIGKDVHGAPVLLISVSDELGRGWLAPIVLEHLTVQHDLACRVSHPDGATDEERFTVVRCTGADSALHTYFLRVASAIVSLLGPAPSPADITRAVDKLVELFRTLSVTPRKSVQGLWAELLLISVAHDAAALVRAWHVLPEDRYDFSAGSHRIEVKSTAGETRQHYFALEQLHPPPETQVLVASLLVERAGAGISLGELAAEARSKVGSDPQLLLHVDRIVTLTLGSGWRHAQEERFDRDLATKSLAFFEPAAIPQIGGSNVPPGVSNVRFMADLTGVAPIDLREYRGVGGLFRAALRR